MLPYFLLFAFFAIGALLSHQRPVVAAAAGAEAPGTSPTPMLAVGGILMTILIGFRFEVGGDWEAYLGWWRYAGLADLPEILAMSDPAYHVLNWLARQFGVEVWGVNLVCGILFSWGLIRFAGTQPYPWLTLVVAVPYLVTVVAMGYSRQAVAIGILMAGYAAVFRGRSFARFAFYAILATLFHKTALLALPLVIFSMRSNRLLSLIGGAALILGLYFAFLAEDVDMFVRNYVDAGYSSQGAAIRVALSLFPALLFLVLAKRLQFDGVQEQFWRLHSFAAIALAVGLFLVPSSTAVDRVALYIFPLQLAILGRLPLALVGAPMRLAVIGYALATQFVWLNYAAHAALWVPYRFYPF